MNITAQSSAVNSALANTLLANQLFADKELGNSPVSKLSGSKAFSPQENHLLAAMSYDEWNKLEPDMEEVDFSINQVLCEHGKTPAYMYFPTTALVSLLYRT